MSRARQPWSDGSIGVSRARQQSLRPGSKAGDDEKSGEAGGGGGGGGVIRETRPCLVNGCWCCVSLLRSERWHRC